MTTFGYGKILDVDLSARDVGIREVDPGFARKFVGGMGFSAKILYDEVGVDVDPLGPQNIVVFANGPLTGTHAPCGARTEITTKHPLTGNIGTGNAGGLWGAKLKHAGFDLVIVRGRADRPVYLWIDDGDVTIKEAGHLWGKDTADTTDALCEELDSGQPSSISVTAIGPAGENLVRYACTLNDYHHSASRCGAGAVMGSKKLKAIAVRGSGSVQLAKPEEFREAARKARERILTADRANSVPVRVGAGSQRLVGQEGSLPGKNFQTGFLPGWLETRTREIAMTYFDRLEATCYACPVPCFLLMEVKEGKYAGTKISRGQHGGVVSDWGAKCAIDNLPAIWACKEMCQRLGMDYPSAAGSIAFAMELFQRGLLTVKDTDGLALTWGNEDATVAMVQKIALREGFGDVLAEGSARAAKIIGKGAEQFVMSTKGMELMSISDPRAGRRGWHFGELTNPRGGDNIKNTHCYADRYNPNWWLDKWDMFEDAKARAYPTAPEEVGHSWEGVPAMCRWFEDLYSAINALGLCFIPSGVSFAIGPTYLSELFASCTGWDTSPQDIIRYGETAFTVVKCYAMREGLTRKDDTWPDRFFDEPLPEGPAKGAILSRERIGQLLDEYYGLRGWDQNLGVPTREKLTELGLAEMAAGLTALGRIG